MLRYLLPEFDCNAIIEMNRLQLNIELYEYIMCVYRACYPIHGIVMLHIIHLEANKSVSKDDVRESERKWLKKQS